MIKCIYHDSDVQKYEINVLFYILSNFALMHPFLLIVMGGTGLRTVKNLPTKNNSSSSI